MSAKPKTVADTFHGHVLQLECAQLEIKQTILGLDVLADLLTLTDAAEMITRDEAAEGLGVLLKATTLQLEKVEKSLHERIDWFIEFNRTHLREPNAEKGGAK